MEASFVWWGIIIYIVFTGFIAYLSRHRSQGSMPGYFLGNRKMGGFVSAMSYSATTFSAFMLVGLAGLTYQGGIGALGFELLYLCGVSLIVIFGPRFWLVGKKFGYVTPSELLGDRYNSQATAIVTALCSCLFLIPYAAVQLAGIGYLLQGMTDGAISFAVGTVLATVVAIVFAMVAGLRSVAWTDALQAIVMIITATVVVLVVIHRLGGFEHFFSSVTEEHPGMMSVPGKNGFFTFSTFLGLTLPWIFFSISNPQVSQRLFTPRTMKDLRQMLLGFLVFGFIYTIVSILWGLAAATQFPDLSTADLATPTLLASGLVPTVLGVIVMVGIMAAAVSTIDSILLTLSSLVARDIFAAARKSANDSRQLLIGKIVIPVIAVLAFLFAQLELNLIAVLSVSASAGLLVMVPSIVGAFFWKRGTGAGAVVSVVLGGSLVFYLELTGTQWLSQGSGVWGLLVSLISFVIVSLLTEAPRQKAAHFLGYVKEALKSRGAF